MLLKAAFVRFIILFINFEDVIARANTLSTWSGFSFLELWGGFFFLNTQKESKNSLFNQNKAKIVNGSNLKRGTEEIDCAPSNIK